MQATLVCNENPHDFYSPLQDYLTLKLWLKEKEKPKSAIANFQMPEYEPKFTEYLKYIRYLLI